MNSARDDLICLDPPTNSNRTREAPFGSKTMDAVFKDARTLDDLDVHKHCELADRNPAACAAAETARQAHGKGMRALSAKGRPARDRPKKQDVGRRVTWQMSGRQCGQDRTAASQCKPESRETPCRRARRTVQPARSVRRRGRLYALSMRSKTRKRNVSWRFLMRSTY